MSAADFDSWTPEETGGPVITRVNQVSAVESSASPVPMKSNTKKVPRSGGMAVGVVDKGDPYPEDDSENDDILLTAKKFGEAIRIEEEDLEDTEGVADILATKQYDWAGSYAKLLDNATLAVTAAAVGANVPFVSVYSALAQNDTDTGYTANSNITKTGSGGVTYDLLSAFLEPIEDGDYFDEGNTIVIASPSFRRKFRGIKDSTGAPIFVQGLAGTPDTLFGLQVKWSTGARTSATATTSPTGHPLLIAVNKNFLRLGIRTPVQTRFSPADGGIGMLTDENILQMRVRRGFALGHPDAAAILEDNS